LGRAVPDGHPRDRADVPLRRRQRATRRADRAADAARDPQPERVAARHRGVQGPAVGRGGRDRAHERSQAAVEGGEGLHQPAPQPQHHRAAPDRGYAAEPGVELLTARVLRHVAAAIALIALIAVTYGAALEHEFVFDDQALVVDNPVVRLPLSQAHELLLGTESGIVYRPLRMLSYMVDHHLAGG